MASELTTRAVKTVSVVSAASSVAVDAVSVVASKAADTIVIEGMSDALLNSECASDLGNAMADMAQKKRSGVTRVAAAVYTSVAKISEGVTEAANTVSKKTADAAEEVITHKSLQFKNT